MRKLNKQDEMRMARMEAELEELKKAVQELQLKDGKVITIRPSAHLGRLPRSSQANSDNGGADQS